ncbi:MAG: hypothetical protein M3Q49_03065 [Actinomycetota bacterium]|nr:hypothetical protein [Actinomycetota bacterium]
MDTIPAAGRHDLTDEQWTILESLPPVGKKQGRPPAAGPARRRGPAA